MISLQKLKILAPTQKLPKTVGDLGKLIVAKGFKKVAKVQKIAKSCLEILKTTFASCRNDLSHKFDGVTLCVVSHKIPKLA